MTDSSKFREEWEYEVHKGNGVPSCPPPDWVERLLTALEEKDKEIAELKYDADGATMGQFKLLKEIESLRAEVEKWKQKADEFQTKGGILAYEKEDLEKDVSRLKKEMSNLDQRTAGKIVLG